MCCPSPLPLGSLQGQCKLYAPHLSVSSVPTGSNMCARGGVLVIAQGDSMSMATYTIAA